MIVYLQDQLAFDGDEFSEARGRRKKRPAARRRPTAKRRKRANERSAPMARRRPSSGARRPSSSSGSRTKMSVEKSVIGDLQKRQPKPKPNRMGSETQRAKRFANPKMKPLPPYVAKKQGVAATQPVQPVQPEQPKSNKMLYVIGGVALLGIIGYLVLRKK